MHLTWLGPENLSAIEAARKQLSTRPASSYFTSVHWLDACLLAWPPSLGWRMARIESPDGDRYALVGRGLQRRRRLIRSRTLALNESMHDGFDEAYVELNGFFGSRVSEFEPCLVTLLNSLALESDWDEVRLSGLLPEAADAARRVAAMHGLQVLQFNAKPSYWIDLDRVRRAHGGDLLDSLSSNSRQQLRRARRALESELGPLALDRARSAQEALQWLEATAPLHKARWSGRQGQRYSGFDNPHFVTFHRALINASFGSGGIDFFRARAANRPFAYLYCLRLDRTEHFYLSGVDYEIGDRYKPGLLAHVLAIQHCLDQGLSTYDLMAGKNRYKESLANDRSTQEWLVLQRPRWIFSAERAARAIKHRLAPSRITAKHSVAKHKL